jgi:hypothetical protein
MTSELNGYIIKLDDDIEKRKLQSEKIQKIAFANGWQFGNKHGIIPNFLESITMIFNILDKTIFTAQNWHPDYTRAFDLVDYDWMLNYLQEIKRGQDGK